jgi:hypothetical protein
LNQEDINHITRSIKSNKIEEAIKSLPKKKSIGPNRFTAQFYHPLWKNKYQQLLKLYHKIEREGTLPNSLYEVSIILIPKLDKDTTNKENYRPITLINLDTKIFNKTLAN